MWYLQNFAHGTAVVLSWYVQIFVVIWWTRTELQQNELTYWMVNENRSELGPWSQESTKTIIDPQRNKTQTFLCTFDGNYCNLIHNDMLRHTWNEDLVKFILPRIMRQYLPYYRHARLAHSSPWSKWPPFRRRSFQMHFREWKDLYFYKNFVEVCP